MPVINSIPGPPPVCRTVLCSLQNKAKHECAVIELTVPQDDKQQTEAKRSKSNRKHPADLGQNKIYLIYVFASDRNAQSSTVHDSIQQQESTPLFLGRHY